ncbi:MAG: hypothetical protein L6R30_11515 [Thermoanaerobaculia bacterium]|nr:hypothetical protein [Thermoanaerobaculia bacterium]
MQDETPSTGLNEDFLDLLAAFSAHEVAFVVVGAHALAIHGIPRATGDLDVLVQSCEANAQRVLSALREFGAPVDAHGLTEEDLSLPGTVYQMGLPPRRIDILTSVSGLSFEEAHATRVEIRIGDIVVGFLGREALLKNKRAAARPKDLADVELLESSSRAGKRPRHRKA